METDILIIGAGVTGLTAACLLKRAGVKVEVVEARDRVGGRILTQSNPLGGDPVELGAELVHGLPEESRLWLDPAQDLEVRDGDFLIFEDGQLTSSPGYFRKLGEILEQLSAPLRHDQSFQQWLDARTVEDPQVKDWVKGYVQGYHAADASDISVEALQEIERESQEVNAVEGAQFFRGGQSQFVSRLVQEFAQPVLTRHCVRRIRWSSGGVEVEFDRAEVKSMRAQKVVVTIPVGVLQVGTDVESGVASQEGRVMFQPELPKVFVESLSYLKMGTALRMNFLFRRAPWSLLPDLPEFAMILDSTPGALFRVWWKRGHNQIVGWSGGPSEDHGQSKGDLQDHGVQALARLFSLPESQIREDLENTFTHDWNSDPYSRGVYPYVTVGGRARIQRCFEPIENVLYFAGDAECLGAYLGTINGAVQSGTRVARRILGSTHSS